MADATRILKAVGEDGTFQVVFLMCVQSLRILALLNSQFMTFGLYKPQWECQDTRMITGDSDGSTTEMLTPTNVSTDRSTYSYTPAKGFDTLAADLGVENDSLSSYDLECSMYQSCQDVKFDKSSSTIVSEWNLVCDAEWAARMIITLQMIGFLFGCLFGGQIGERFGRKTILYIAAACLSSLNIACGFSPSWEAYAVLQCLIGASAGAIVTHCLVYSVEFLGQKGRTFLKIFPALGMSSSMFAVMVYFIRDWKTLHFVCGTVCGVLCLPALWLPESLRWLYVHGRVDKVKAAAGKISRLNGQKTLPTDLGFECSDKEEEQHYNFRNLFRGPFCRITISISTVWMVRDLVHYMICFGVKTFAGDFYINLLLYSLSEIPVFILVAPVVQFLGNRQSASFFYCVAFLACMSVLGVHYSVDVDTRGTVITYLALVAKISVSACNQINGVYTSELFPTVIRGVGLGFSVAIGIVGGAIAPFLIPSSPSSLPISFAIAGALLLLVCVLLQTMPETKSQPLRDFDDYERGSGLNKCITADSTMLSDFRTNNFEKETACRDTEKVKI